MAAFVHWRIDVACVSSQLTSSTTIRCDVSAMAQQHETMHVGQFFRRGKSLFRKKEELLNYRTVIRLKVTSESSADEMHAAHSSTEIAVMLRCNQFHLLIAISSACNEMSTDLLCEEVNIVNGYDELTFKYISLHCKCNDSITAIQTEHYL